MESEILVPADGLKLTLQNGFHEHVSAASEDIIPSDFVSEGINEDIGATAEQEDIENALKLSGTASNEPITEGSDFPAESNISTISKEREENIDHSKQFKSENGQGKSKNEKSSFPRNISSTSVKKNKDGKDAEHTSSVLNGSGTSHPHPKQASKSRSFNDRQAKISKEQPERSDGEGVKESTNLKPMKKGPPCKSEGESETSLTGDEKPQRVGRLPNYGFSFRCNERAEKRREFYSKLEEKIQAKEEEKSTMQAKSKETQEAEIRMLRKSLNFKATPMPSFYQEPPPPKVELKKIPPTRAKSPKLGRKKSSNSSDPAGYDGVEVRVARLSLDENMSLNNNFKAQSPARVENKPKRRSLPRLPSEKTAVSGVTNAGRSSAPKVKNVEKTPSSNGKKEEKWVASEAMTEKTACSGQVGEEKNATKVVAPLSEEENGVVTAELGETEIHTDGESGIEEQHQPHALVQEPVELDHTSST